MEIIVFAGIGGFVLLAFLGYVESHWIAPAVLFFVPAPLVIAGLWSEPYFVLATALLALLVFLYAAFGLGRITNAILKKSPNQKLGFHVRKF